MRPCASNTMLRELEVPWSRARRQCGRVVKSASSGLLKPSRDSWRRPDNNESADYRAGHRPSRRHPSSCRDPRPHVTPPTRSSLPVEPSLPDACDVLVVGGGINGAGIARDLAGRGLKVVLCEQGRPGAGDVVVQHQADPRRPALPRIQRVLAGAQGAGRARGAAAQRAAHHVAAALRDAARPGHASGLDDPHSACSCTTISPAAKYCPASRTVDLRRHVSGAPLQPRFTRGFVYSDGWVDDARLVALNAIDADGARRHGADALALHATRSVRSPRQWQVTLNHVRTANFHTVTGARARQRRRPVGRASSCPSTRT